MLRFLQVSVLTTVVPLLNSCTTKAPEPQTEFRPVATIRELMRTLVDPTADEVWNATAFTIDASGSKSKAPKTDEEWAEVRRSAMRLAEASNLLVVPGRHVGALGEQSANPGIELAPAEIEQNINKDRAKFVRLAHALQEQALRAVQAIDEKDVEKLTHVGGDIDAACENCHLTFWHPNQEQYIQQQTK